MMKPTIQDFRVTPWRATCAAVAAMAVAGSLSLAEGPSMTAPMVEPIAAVDPRPVREMRRPDFRASAEAFGVPGFRGDRAHVAAIVAEEAERQGVPVQVALAVAHVESGFRAGAIGPSTPWGRARGVMQVLPSTAERVEPGSSRRLLDARTGARVGVRYLRGALAECVGDVRCAAHRYHGGSNRRMWGPRTRAYGEMVSRRAGQRHAALLASRGPTGPGRIEQDPLAFQAWLRR